ncbi:MAG: CDP-archaeol synthase [Methylocystis sp.]|uniref:CDP-archaeol synthase n=1 Tax=Methylocystis sp. TaxID=1911079 RepID=UPI003DA50199
MNFGAIGQILLLLAIANGAPILATRVLGERMARPLDGGAVFLDGRPLFGQSKTLRGVTASLAATALGAHLLALPWALGGAIAALAMLGDLTSSFLKRRSARASSARALGLDQIPESLFPALYAGAGMSLHMMDVVVVVTIFFAGALVVSRLLYALSIRERPY